MRLWFLSVPFFKLTANGINCWFFPQDYNWWWRSFLTSGFTAFYLSVYCVHYFLTKLEIEGMASTFLYLGYTSIMVFMFFVMTGKRMHKFQVASNSSCVLGVFWSRTGSAGLTYIWDIPLFHCSSIPTVETQQLGNSQNLGQPNRRSATTLDTLYTAVPDV